MQGNLQQPGFDVRYLGGMERHIGLSVIYVSISG